MAKTKDKALVTSVMLSPYVRRALQDPELRDDLLAAFVAARSLYGQLAKRNGIQAKAARVSDKDFQKQIQELVAGLSDVTERLQGKETRKRHKMRNRVIFFTGMTLGVLYNPWTGQATRAWIMERVAGRNGDGLDMLADEIGSEGMSTDAGTSPDEAA